MRRSIHRFAPRNCGQIFLLPANPLRSFYSGILRYVLDFKRRKIALGRDAGLLAERCEKEPMVYHVPAISIDQKLTMAR
jgi:hypothetical protein